MRYCIFFNETKEGRLIKHDRFKAYVKDKQRKVRNDILVIVILESSYFLILETEFLIFENECLILENDFLILENIMNI